MPIWGYLDVFRVGETACERGRLEMDDPHSSNEEEWEKDEHGQSRIPVERPAVIVNRPALQSRENGPEDSARCVEVPCDLRGRQILEVGRPEGDEGQHQERRN